MQVDYCAAETAFALLPDAKQNPYLHPAYIRMDAIRDQELTPVFFVHRENDDVYYHGFHVAPVPGSNYYDIQSPYGYGGPLSSTDDPSFLQNAWQAYKEWCQAHSILVEFIRFHPLLENWHNHEGEIFYNRDTVAVHLEGTDLSSGYRTLTRRKIRQAMKNQLRIEECDAGAFSAIFPALYTSLMKRLGAETFYFFPQEYYCSVIAWDKARRFVCIYEDQVVAAALFLINGKYGEYHLGASTALGRDLGAMHLLMHEAFTHAQRAGCSLMHLGGGTDGSGDNPLLFFKTGFSQQRYDFKIGKYLHNPEAYLALKRKWEQENNKQTNRILFYRF